MLTHKQASFLAAYHAQQATNFHRLRSDLDDEVRRMEKRLTELRADRDRQAERASTHEAARAVFMQEMDAERALTHEAISKHE